MPPSTITDSSGNPFLVAAGVETPDHAEQRAARRRRRQADGERERLNPATFTPTNCAALRFWIVARIARPRLVRGSKRYRAPSAQSRQDKTRQAHPGQTQRNSASGTINTSPVYQVRTERPVDSHNAPMTPSRISASENVTSTISARLVLEARQA